MIFVTPANVYEKNLMRLDNPHHPHPFCKKNRPLPVNDYFCSALARKTRQKNGMNQLTAKSSV